ncbi:MAG: DnaJ domain-containing protein [Anaerolineales bacterium]|nr:DnaJ domain-containing protein [Anaerolineales bacterium]
MSTGYLDNYYARLGISKRATITEIRKAYHQAARRLHPDTNQDAGATELFLQIQEAYEILSDEGKRATYDRSLPEDIDPPVDVMVNAIYSRGVLPMIDKPQLVYVLLDLMSMPTKEEYTAVANPPLNLSLVLDTSTSMKGARLDMVKATAVELVRQLKPQDILSVVAFDDRAEVIVPATRGLDYKRIESRIGLLSTRGGTEIFMGLDTAVSEVNRNLSTAYLNHIILITDGRTYGDEADCLNLAEQASQRGITINGIGIGDAWNDEFMDELTRMTGGTSLYAQRAKDIKTLLEKQFRGISQTYANRVKLEFETAADVELRYAFRLSPEVGSLSNNSPIAIGNLPLGPRLSIIMEFIVNSVGEDIDSLCLLDGTLRLDIPTRAIPQTSCRVSLSRPTGLNPELEPPPQMLIKAMSRLSLYRMQEQARKDLANGEVEKATQRLQNLATQLLVSGEPGLAQTVMLEVKSIQNGGSLNGEAEKQIKYGTRALLLPSGMEERQL